MHLEMLVLLVSQVLYLSVLGFVLVRLRAVRLSLARQLVQIDALLQDLQTFQEVSGAAVESAYAQVREAHAHRTSAPYIVPHTREKP